MLRRYAYVVLGDGCGMSKCIAMIDRLWTRHLSLSNERPLRTVVMPSASEVVACTKICDGFHCCSQHGTGFAQACKQRPKNQSRHLCAA